MIDLADIILVSSSILSSCIISGVIFYIYKKVYSDDKYKPKFNILLVMMVFITTMLINLIKTSLMTSLGLLSLISIIRFRVKLKDFRDISFILWAIAVGVGIGTENYTVAFFYSIVISFLQLLLNRVLVKNYNTTLILRDKKINQNNLEEFFQNENVQYTLSISKCFNEYEEYIYHLENKKNLTKFQEKFLKNFEFDYVKFI